MPTLPSVMLGLLAAGEAPVHPGVAMLAVFGIFLFLGMPVAFAIAFGALAGYALLPHTTMLGLVQTMAQGPQKLSLLAIPFFILAGRMMGQGGIARRLIGFSQSLLGGARGGTAYVNVASSMFFGGVSGSAVADVSSIGSVLMPAMEEEGYDKGFALAVTVSSSTIGLIIPPSNTLVLYAAVAAGIAPGVTTETMFFAGVIPGVLVGAALLLLCAVLSWRRGYPKGRFPGWATFVKNGLGSTWAFAMIVLILSGIVLGWFTAEESAAVAVVYAAFVVVCVYRELSPRALALVVAHAVATTGLVMFLIAASEAMSKVFVYCRMTEPLRDFCVWLSHAQPLFDDTLTFLLLMNLILLLAGTVLDMTPAVLLFTPLFLPVAMSLGVHPVHFGIVMLINLCIGLCTPPVGNCLFVGCSISRLPLAQSVRPLAPFYAAMVAALVLVTAFEDLTLWLPGLLRR